MSESDKNLTVAVLLKLKDELSAGMQQAADNAKASLDSVGAQAKKLDTSVGMTAQEAAALNVTMRERAARMNDSAAASKNYFAAQRALDDELGVFLSKANPAYAAQRKLDEGHDLLTRGLQAGLISQKDYDATLGVLGKQYTDATKKVATFAAGVEKGAFSTVQARRELVVLGHEAVSGNFSRIPGSLMVLAERANLSAGALVGLGGATLAGAAAIGALVVAAAQGAEETDAMNRALETTSNFAGQTRDSMRHLATDMSEAGQVTVGEAKNIVTGLVASGQIGAEAFGKVAGLAAGYARAIGEDAEHATPQLVKLFSDPAKGAADLNRTMHFLSVAELEHLRTLQESGRYTEAQAELADKLSQKLSQQTENLGSLASAWRSIKGAASSAWDAMMGVGRTATPEEELKKAKDALASIQQRMADFKAGNIGKLFAPSQTDLLQAEVAVKLAQSKVDAVNARAKAANDAAAENAAMQRLLDDTARFKPASETLKEMRNQASALRAELDRLAASGHKNSDEYVLFSGRLKKLNEDMANIGKKEAAKTTATRLPSLTPVYDAEAQTLQDAMKNQAAILDTAFSGRLVDAEAYWRAKRALDNRQLDAEAQSLQTALRAQQDLAAKLSTVKPRDPNQKVEIADRLERANAEAAKLQVQIDALSGKRVALNFSYDVKEAGIPEQAYSQAQQQLASIRQQLDAEVTVGLKSQTAASIELRQETGRLGAQLAGSLIPRLREMVAAAPTDADREKWKAMIAEIQSMQAQGSQVGPFAGLKAGLDEYKNNVTDTFTTVKNAVGSAFKGMEDALVSFVKTGKLDFKSLADSIISDIIRIQVQKTITQPLANAVSGSASGSSDGFWASLLSAVFSANGNVFQQGKLMAFANGGSFTNGVVNQPTLFPLGVMGERGPEAIVPLSRMSNGQLGIQQAGGGGGSMIVNIIESPGNGGKTNQRQDNNGTNVLDVYVEQIKGSIAGDISSGRGAIPNALAGSYGLNRVAGAY